MRRWFGIGLWTSRSCQPFWVWMVSTDNLRRPSGNICSFNLGAPGVARLMEWALYAPPPHQEGEWKKKILLLISQIGGNIWCCSPWPFRLKTAHLNSCMVPGVKHESWAVHILRTWRAKLGKGDKDGLRTLSPFLPLEQHSHTLRYIRTYVPEASRCWMIVEKPL